ncbi:limonoid glucosyltransferase [Trifolium repens]|nr:limonoid glucosyltransferase [Trifolium repens]
MGSETPINILLVSYPAQGHINPLLRLAKCLAAKGSSVIFLTTEQASKDMKIDITHKSSTPIAYEHNIPSALLWIQSTACFTAYYNYFHKLEMGLKEHVLPNGFLEETRIRLGYGFMENKLITRDEVKKCLLEATTGEKAEEMKKNAVKWKKAAEDAVAVGGSSDRNLDEFMEDIKKRGVLNIQKI